MRQVKKLLFSILLILALEAMKRFFLDQSSASYSFFYNLLSCAQVAVLLWAVISLFFKKILFSVIAFFVLAILAEVICALLLSNPRYIPKPLMPAFSFYYDHFDCRLIQYEPSKSRFDTGLYYKLIEQNNFVYSNAEYSDSFYVNTKGLRDNEASLTSPEIICIGDSYTLGWGARQDETFAEIIEKKSGLKVLNVSMSSYGTAREVKTLRGVDLSNLKFILVQYCFNDAEENNAFVKDKNFVNDEKSYDSVVALHKWTRMYFPGRHFFTLSKLAIGRRDVKRFNGGESTNLNDAKNFLQILSGISIDSTKTKLIVFELSPFESEKGFVRNLREINMASNVFPLAADSLLKKDDYYILDLHLKKSGHQKIADALLQKISELSD